MNDFPDSFVRNTWYMAAWSHEVGESLLRRKLLGRAILLYRKSDGGAVAMNDRCPHRFAPLSMGDRKGDTIVCRYHGLTFDDSGNCVRNPFADKLPRGACVQTYPLVERDGIVWFWPGDPDKADANAISDFSMLFVAGHGAPLTGYMPMAANYEYGTDNLLDLSHIEFVHRGTFAGRGVIFAGQHELLQEANRLQSNWWMPNISAPPHTAGIYPPDMRCDHWLDMRWDAPATMYLQVGGCPTGEPRESGIINHQAHILTPETEGTTHYFWASTRNLPPSPEGDAMVHGLLSAAFNDEDKPVIEAAYRNLDGEDFWQAQPCFVGIDAGGTRARRIIETLRKGEKDAL